LRRSSEAIERQPRRFQQADHVAAASAPGQLSALAAAARHARQQLLVADAIVAETTRQSSD
jgi:hypothetical protein